MTDADRDSLGIGRLVSQGRDLGSSFAISSGLALTAAHVVRGLDERSFQYVSESEQGTIPARISDVDASLDAASIILQNAASDSLSIGRAIEGANWRIPAHPRPNDPLLTGTISDVRRRLLNSEGREVSLLQLAVDQELGDYRGYSGAAVTLASPRNAVVGILVEQALWRTRAEQPPPVANILYALPINTVIERFDLDPIARHVTAVDLIPTAIQGAITRVDSVLVESLNASGRQHALNWTKRQTLNEIKCGLEALHEALASTNESTRNRRLDLAEENLNKIRHLPVNENIGGVRNSKWLAVSYMGLWLVYSLRGDDDAALEHALRTFLYEPAMARTQYFPQVFNSLMGRQHVELEAERDKERRNIIAAKSFPAMQAALVGLGGAVVLAGTIAQSKIRGQGGINSKWMVRYAKMVAGGMRPDDLRVPALNALDERYEYDLNRMCQEVAEGLLKERSIRLPNIPAARRPLRSRQVYAALRHPAGGSKEAKAELDAEGAEVKLKEHFASLRRELNERGSHGDWPGVYARLKKLTDPEYVKENWNVDISKNEDLIAAHEGLSALAQRAHEEIATILVQEPVRNEATESTVVDVAWHQHTAHVAVIGTISWYAHIYDISQPEGRRTQPQPDQWKELSRVKAAKGLSSATAVTFTPSGDRIATGNSHGTVRIYEVSDGKLLIEIHSRHKGVRAVAFSADGTALATAGADNTARVWDAATGTQQVELHHQGAVNSVAFSPDGRLLATAGADNTARVWDAATGTQQAELQHYDPVDAVAFSPDGTLLGTASYVARIWHMGTERLLEVTSDAPISWLQFSLDGAQVATAGTAFKVWPVKGSR